MELKLYDHNVVKFYCIFAIDFYRTEETIIDCLDEGVALVEFGLEFRAFITHFFVGDMICGLLSLSLSICYSYSYIFY